MCVVVVWKCLEEMELICCVIYSDRYFKTKKWWGNIILPIYKNKEALKVLLIAVPYSFCQKWRYCKNIIEERLQDNVVLYWESVLGQISGNHESINLYRSWRNIERRRRKNSTWCSLILKKIIYECLVKKYGGVSGTRESEKYVCIIHTYLLKIYIKKQCKYTWLMHFKLGCINDPCWIDISLR